MKIFKLFLFCALLSSLNSLLSQEVPQVYSKEIGFSVGIGKTYTKETRYSNVIKENKTLHFGMSFSKSNETTRQSHDFDFSYSLDGTGDKVSFKLISPKYNFGYQKKYKGLWIGGSFNNETLLLFPRAKRNYFTNNPISYTINTGLGLMVSDVYEIKTDANKRLTAYWDVNTSLINYLIRPAYAHPYPEHYLENDRFSPTRKDMWKSIVKGGKIKTVNKFQNINVVLGINYFYNDSIKLGLSYQFYTMNIQDDKSFNHNDHSLNVNFHYIY